MINNEIADVKRIMALMGVSERHLGRLEKIGVVKKIARNAYDIEASLDAYRRYKEKEKEKEKESVNNYHKSFKNKEKEKEKESTNIHNDKRNEESRPINDLRVSANYLGKNYFGKDSGFVLRLKEKNIISDDGNGLFFVEESVRRYFEYMSTNKDDATKRKKYAEAEIKEIELKKMKEELISVDDFKRVHSIILNSLKKQIYSFPVTLPLLLLNLSRSEMQSIILKKIDDAFNEMVNEFERFTNGR